MFVDLAEKLKKAIGTSNVTVFRQAICEVLYLASLKLVHLNKAKLLTDELGNDLSDDANAKGVLETLMVQVAQCFGISDGKLDLVMKSFIVIYLTFVFFYLDLTIGGSNKKKGGTAGGSSSKKKLENPEVSASKKTKTTHDVSRVTSVPKAARKSNK